MSLDTSPPEILRDMVANWNELEKLEFLADWRRLARPGQLAPEGDWRTWLILAGRGFGKTRSGAEWVREKVRHGAGHIGLIGPTFADVRDIMVEGESGILAVCGKCDETLDGRPNGRPLFEVTKRRITWPNGTVATLFSADEPDRLRGPQHDAIWADELCAWRYAQAAWDMAMFGLRLGRDPRICVTTTPRPIKLLKALLDDERTAVTRGTTYDNAVNLAPSFIEAVKARYGETDLGRQELKAEIVDQAEGALWDRKTIEEQRCSAYPELRRIVIGLDPPATGKATSDACGIVAAGLGHDGKAYVIADETLSRASPAQWAAKAVALYARLQADLIVAEVNQGGDMVEAVLRQVDRRVALRKVTAHESKRKRAEPVSMLYKQGEVLHAGAFPALEDEMCNFTHKGLAGGGSPDRLDALVWALGELMLGTPSVPQVRGL